MPKISSLSSARRLPFVLALGLATAVTAPMTPGLISAAHAQSNAGDAAFVQSLAQRMIAVVNGPGSAAEKKAQIQPLLDQDVDVDAIARFCLGRFWRTATPEQQAQYTALFHQVLTNSIDDKLGEYRGVGITVGQATQQDGKTYVATVISRPNQPTANVQWVISHATGQPRIVDVVAEGVSLSLTQRSDYASFLAHNGNDVGRLIAALKRQVSRE
ncbi:ABC transporter substrate-binding protein [Acetobacteraceae bacterium KSS8]|uniref:ABC transporter substrate-binding protein n=1 Tax=Endosaccharibacter trunci TaxID=2812733 RepID=A0ABT1W8K6_9PROT|nr:ABC transporter substrate-binding protein [Acetobacteraceae bacterium KSS8]